MAYKSAFVHTLVERGYYYQSTDLEGVDTAAFASERGGDPFTAYIGFDCTAPSLHVGSLMQIMLLRTLQKCGGKPIALMGGGTTKVGDPSFRDTERPLLGTEMIETNKAGIKTAFAPFLTFGDGRNDAIMLDNADWLDHLGYMAFLRDYGRHFTINKMVAMDSVKSRLEREQPLTFLEFNYMLLQAYDFLELNRRVGCRAQMGGSDQWGNIIQGVELCRRVDGKEVFGITSPLLTTASGTKMGKTASGAVWLNADMLAPFDYWQYWRNAEDGDVGRFLKLFTDMPMDEIARLEALGGAEINHAKIILATEATAMLHGRDVAEASAATAKAQFSGQGDAGGLPTVMVDAADADSGLSLAALFVKAGLVASNGEAKRQAQGGGLRLDDDVVGDVGLRIDADRLAGGIKLSLGRKRHVLVKVG
jgi:tyrosyl-tRNA synthetase